MEEVCYDIHGLNLKIGADTPDLLVCAEELFGNFRASHGAENSWTITLRRGEFDPTKAPKSGKLLWRGELAPGVLATNYVGPGYRRFDLINRGSCTLDLPRREVQITMLPSASPRTSHYFLMSSLCTGLTRASHMPIHASCLAARRDGEPCSVLIIAPSGTGKSTTSYGLTSGGWKLMGDDLSLLHIASEPVAGHQVSGAKATSQKKSGQRVLAWGYPRHCHVRRPTFELLPWLRELPLTRIAADETWQFPLRALGARAIGPKPQLLPAGLIMLLDRPNRMGHRCERVDPATALAWICQENVQPIEGYTDPDAHAIFVTFGQLVRQTPAVRVSAGPDVERLAEFLARETGVTA